MATLHAPDPPRVVGLDQLVGRLLAPRRRSGVEVSPDRLVELEALVVEPRFSKEDHAAVDALLEGVRDQPLSALLARAPPLRPGPAPSRASPGPADRDRP